MPGAQQSQSSSASSIGSLKWASFWGHAWSNSYTQATPSVTYLFCGLVVEGNLDGDARAGQHVQQLAVMSLHTCRHTSDSSCADCSCRLLNVPGLEGPAGLEEQTLTCLHLCQPHKPGNLRL